MDVTMDETPAPSSLLSDHSMENNEEKSLSTCFDEALAEYEAISNCDLPTNSSEIQYKIKKCITILENCTRTVSLADIFSGNENVEEVATGNLKYFLLPALLGYLTLKITHGDRLELINTADIYFRDFMKRCKNYGITDIDIEPDKEDESAMASNDQQMMPMGMNSRMPFDIGAMARTRAQKIARFKEQKELETEIEGLRKSMKLSGDSATPVDEELLRNYNLKLIKSNVSKCVDEIECLASEKQFVKFKKEHPEQAPDLSKPPPKSKPLIPIIITKDEVQKKVFGAGYPSLPKYTVQEFCEQRIKDGIWAKPDENNTKCLQVTAEQGNSQAEQEEIEKERKIEEDDPEELARQRAMDEFKDDHKRGYGNRYNRS